MNANLSLNIDYSHVLSTIKGLGNTTDPLNIDSGRSWSNGDGAGQVNHGWHDKRTLAAVSADDLDLTDASQATAWAEGIEFDIIKMLFIENLSTTSSDVIWLTWKADATDWRNMLDVPAWLGSGVPSLYPALKIRGGGFVLVGIGDDDAAGYAIAAPESNIRIWNPSASNSVDYIIAVLGVKS